MNDYVFQNKYGVTGVGKRAVPDQPKEICFIYPDYQEKFRIPDGEQVIVTYPTGKNRAFVCKYIDDEHILVGRRAYHIREYAEHLQKLGAHVYPFPEKRMVWQDIDLDINDWIDDLRAEYPDLGEDELIQKMYEINAEYLGDERDNLNIQCGSEIIVFGDIGRWNGRVCGYKIIESGNIRDCLYSDCDMNEWYVDRNGDLCSTQIHHDGRNYLYYRKFKDGLSDDDRDDFLDKFCDGKATQKDIDRVTDKIGTIIAQVYGWEFPTEEKRRIPELDARS
jgi:hypothetical protein